MKRKKLLIILLVIAIVATGLGLGGWQWLLARTGPEVQKLQSMVGDRLAAHGGTFVPLSGIPLTLQEAVVNTEDKSFWSNTGVDPVGIARSLLADISSGDLDQGGSTITQQLARNMLLTSKKTFMRKVKEILLALVITHYYSKADILEMYFNEVYLGHGAYGVEQAASVYFDVLPGALTQAQCTMLAGLPQGPSIDDPLNDFQTARGRQRQVLDSMVQSGTISADEADQIFAQPLGLAN